MCYFINKRRTKVAKHEAWELKQLQALPLEEKIKLSQERIKEWYDHWNGQVYISYSGGKDSTVLRHLVKQLYPEVPAVFVNTGLEYPEVRRLAMKNADKVLKPKIGYKKVVEKYGWPVISKEVASKIREVRYTKSEKLKSKRLYGDEKGNGKVPSKWIFLQNAPFDTSHKCCDIMKKYPFKQYEKTTAKKPIIGTMTDESYLRKSNWMKTGCNAFENTRPISSPLSFWTEYDILKYIVQNDLEIPSVYGEIIEENGKLKTTKASRTGCMYCMFGVHLEKEPNRFQRMKIEHPNQYNCFIHRLRGKEVLDYIGVKYE